MASFLRTSAMFAVLLIMLALSGCAVAPVPVTVDELKSQTETDREIIMKFQEPVAGPMTLEEAMARALKYNLDHRLKLMEEALSLKQLDVGNYDMLPRLMASAGYTERNNYNASSSISMKTFQESLEPSTSQDKGHSNADLVFAWNMLDFGVSYYQAKQQADRYLILNERRRKTVQNIIQQVRQSFWLTLGVQKLEDRFPPLLKEVEQALADAEKSENEKLRSPLESLVYRRTLLDILRQLEALHDELLQARPRLAALLNLPPGTTIKLESPSSLEVPVLTENIDQLEMRALLRRPEVVEAHLQERISIDETKKALLRMFPGIEFSTGVHFDSNSYLVNQSWLEGGLRLSWNLFNMLSGPAQYGASKSQTEIAKVSRLALDMAVLTQVHIAYHDLQSKKRQYQRSLAIQEIDSKIHEQTQNAAQTGVQNKLNEIKAAASALMAEYRKYQNYAALQNSYGQMMATVGFDPLPEDIGSRDIKTIAELLRKNESGQISDPIETRVRAIIKPYNEKSFEELMRGGSFVKPKTQGAR